MLSHSDDVAIAVTAPPAGSTLVFTPFIAGPGIFSFILEADPDGRDVAFVSSERATVSQRPTLTVTTATFTSAGTYVLRLNATDVELTGQDDMTVIVTTGKDLSLDVSAFVTGPGVYSLIPEASPSTRDVVVASSENGTSANRPLFTITTAAAPAQPVVDPDPPESAIARAIRLVGAAGSPRRLLATGLPGLSYRIERSTDLKRWDTVETVVSGDNGEIDFSDPSPPAGAAFYRIAYP